MLPLSQQQHPEVQSTAASKSPTRTTKTTITASATIPNRPSSPRQFFKRIYGDLERSVNAVERESSSVSPSRNAFVASASDGTTYPPSTAASDLNASICDSTYQSDGGGSISSPDISISEERISHSCPVVYDAYTHAHPHPHPQHDYGQKSFSAGGGVPATFGFAGGDPHFPAGLSAFLARRRRKEGRQRRQRTTFSTEQTLSLEVEFHRNEYISRSRRFELAENLRLTETQIKIWFQNRRAKDKRIEKAQIDQQYRNFVVANGFMTTIMGQTNYPHPPPSTMLTPNLQQNYYQHQNNTASASQLPAPQPRPATHAATLPPPLAEAQARTLAINNHRGGDVNYTDINSFYRHATNRSCTAAAGVLNSLINSC